MEHKIVKFLQRQDPKTWWTLSALSKTVKTSRSGIRKKIRRIQEAEGCFEFMFVMSLSMTHGERHYNKHLALRLLATAKGQSSPHQRWNNFVKRMCEE